MLADGCVSNQTLDGEIRIKTNDEEYTQFQFVKSNMHSKYFLYVLNIFANSVSQLSFNISEKNEWIDGILYTHAFAFAVCEMVRTIWYPGTKLYEPSDIQEDSDSSDRI